MSADSAMTVVPRKRRGAELFGLLFALVLVLGAYAQVDLNVDGELSARFTTLAIASTVAVVAAHIAVRWRLPYADPVLLPCVVLLNGLGIAMIHRIDLINSPPLDGARTQLIWTTIGVIMFVLVAVVLDRWVVRTRLTSTADWWLAYASIVVFQLLIGGEGDGELEGHTGQGHGRVLGGGVFEQAGPFGNGSQRIGHLLL